MNRKIVLNVYKSDENIVRASIVKCCVWCCLSGLFFESNWFHFIKIKIWLLRQFGAVIGLNCVVKLNAKIKYPWKFSLGDCSWIGEGVWIDNVYPVKIGSNVCVFQGAKIISGNHSWTDQNFVCCPI